MFVCPVIYTVSTWYV